MDIFATVVDLIERARVAVESGGALKEYRERAEGLVDLLKLCEVLEREMVVTNATDAELEALRADSKKDPTNAPAEVRDKILAAHKYQPFLEPGHHAMRRRKFAKESNFDFKELDILWTRMIKSSARRMIDFITRIGKHRGPCEEVTAVVFGVLFKTNESEGKMIALDRAEMDFTSQLTAANTALLMKLNALVEVVVHEAMRSSSSVPDFTMSMFQTQSSARVDDARINSQEATIVLKRAALDAYGPLFLTESSTRANAAFFATFL